jgi:pimeloyl-ACP methyl ester carboxylesterase
MNVREILEAEMHVPRHDGGIVRAVLTGGELADLVMYLPSFGGDHRDALPYLTAYHLTETYGLSVVRMDPFLSLPGGRNLSDEGVMLQDHVHDLRSILHHVRQTYGLGQGKIHAIGHSLSALSVIMAAMDPTVDLASIIIWDGSKPVDPDLHESDQLVYISDGGYYVSFDGMGFTIAASYLESIRQFQLPDPRAWYTPTLIVTAGGNPILLQAGEAYAERLPLSYRYIVQGADHSFLAKRSYTKELHDVTGLWLQGGFLEWPR